MNTEIATEAEVKAAELRFENMTRGMAAIRSGCAGFQTEMLDGHLMYRTYMKSGAWFVSAPMRSGFDAAVVLGRWLARPIGDGGLASAGIYLS